MAKEFKQEVMKGTDMTARGRRLAYQKLERDIDRALSLMIQAREGSGFYGEVFSKKELH